MKNIYKKYNMQDALLVIASYPKRNEVYSQGVCAVASYTKNTLLALQKKNPTKKIIVLTFTIDEEKEIYEENGILIIRCLTRNKPFSFLHIIHYALTFSKVNKVLFEFEFASFGDTFATASLIIYPWILRFLQKEITVVLHQVIFDLRKLAGHIGVNKNSLFSKFLNFGIRSYYQFFLYPTQHVVVLEEVLKEKLEKMLNSKKIVFIPHGVDTHMQKNHKKKIAGFSKSTNDFVILYFGYLTWYKGIDFLIEAIRNIKTLKGKRIKLLVAGGPSFTQSEKPHYQKFLQRIYGLIEGQKHITITGFVPENEMSTVFEQADLVVLPYRAFMSSSGPLSLSMTHNKPILFSNRLNTLLQSSDIQTALKTSGLTVNDITFSLTQKDFKKKLGKAITHKKKLTDLSALLRQTRSFDSISQQYNEMLFPTVPNTNTTIAFIPAIIK